MNIEGRLSSLERQFGGEVCGCRGSGDVFDFTSDGEPEREIAARRCDVCGGQVRVVVLRDEDKRELVNTEKRLDSPAFGLSSDS